MPVIDTRRDWVDDTQIGLTLVLIVFAIRQISLLRKTVADTERAANATKQSADTATAMLKMAHRPRLIVRHVVVDGIGDDGEILTELTNRFIWVTNVGVLHATLQKVHTRWLFATHLPLENPTLDVLDDSTVAVQMPPGGVERIRLQDREVTTDEHIAINNAVAGTMGGFGDPIGTLFLIGFIKYADAIGLRRTYFGFEYNTSKHCFTAVEHPSYSYED